MTDETTTIDPRIAALREPLDPTLVKQRQGGGGRQYDYISSHTAYSNANRIFGPDGWDRRIIGEVRERSMADGSVCFMAQVEVTVMGGCTHQDVGFAVAHPSRDGRLTADAIETAWKGAVTDGYKRALHAISPQFGLDLYDVEPQQSNGGGQQPHTATQTSRQPNPSHADADGYVGNACEKCATDTGEKWKNLCRRCYAISKQPA